MKIATVIPALDTTLKGRWESQSTKGEIWVYKAANPSPHNIWYFDVSEYVSENNEVQYTVCVRFEFELEPDNVLFRDIYTFPLTFDTKEEAFAFTESIIKKAGVS